MSRCEARDLRELEPGVAVLEAVARLRPRRAAVEAAPDARAVPFARPGRVDRASVGVVDGMVDRPSFAERATPDSHSCRRSLLSRRKQPLRVPTITSVVDIDSPPVATAYAGQSVQTARRRETHRYNERRASESTTASSGRRRLDSTCTKCQSRWSSLDASTGREEVVRGGFRLRRSR